MVAVAPLLQVLWADPVPGAGPEVGSVPAAGAAGPWLVCGESAILDQINRDATVSLHHCYWFWRGNWIQCYGHFLFSRMVVGDMRSLWREWQNETFDWPVLQFGVRTGVRPV